MWKSKFVEMFANRNKETVGGYGEASNTLGWQQSATHQAQRQGGVTQQRGNIPPSGNNIRLADTLQPAQCNLNYNNNAQQSAGWQQSATQVANLQNVNYSNIAHPSLGWQQSAARVDGQSPYYQPERLNAMHSEQGVPQQAMEWHEQGGASKYPSVSM